MPSQYNLPRTQDQWTQQDINLYNKLPFYLANLQTKYMTQWTTWNKLFGTQKWEPNMGTTMKGVRGEPTPIQAATFFPNNITTMPKKDVFSIRELSETANVKRHNFESPYFNFNPSFADFRRDQIGYAMKDIMNQTTQRSDQFIRSDVFQKSPFVMISGKPNTNNNDGFNGGDLVAAPTGDGNDDPTQSAKNTAWLQQAIAYVGNGGYDVGALSWRQIEKAQITLCDDMQAPPFEGIVNVPKDNETVKGKWILIGSNEAFTALSYDNYVLANRPLMMNLLNDEFKGIIGGNVAWKCERFPLRIQADGTFAAPQTWESDANAYNYGETVANPNYISAPFEVAFMMGAEAYRAIQVGPPPKEFAGGKMGADKFWKLQWNGEVRLTDQVLIDYGNGRFDLNKYGEFVQLYADMVYGQIPVSRRYLIPIIYRRRRVTTT